jgi:fatty-acyl-CoA synthase
VEECKVVGVSTESGDRAVAFVIPHTGAAVDETALTAHCHAGIAKYKVPARFFPIDEFPVSISPNGVKIQRTKLRDMALAMMAGAGGPKTKGDDA